MSGMWPHDDYDIGSADSLGVITHNIRPIEYDLKQVQDEGYARYNASLHGEWCGYKTDKLPIGECVPVAIAEDVRDELGDIDVRGWVVPDHQLSMFLSRMDEPVYRER